MRISVAIITVFCLHFVQDIQDFNFTQILKRPFLIMFLDTEVYYTVHLKKNRR